MTKKRHRSENIPNANEKKVKTIENQRVSDLSKKRHRNENIPNADEKKVKTIENQRVSDLSKKRHRNEKTFQMRKKIKLKTREISLIFTFI